MNKLRMIEIATGEKPIKITIVVRFYNGASIILLNHQAMAN